VGTYLEIKPWKKIGQPDCSWVQLLKHATFKSRSSPLGEDEMVGDAQLASFASFSFILFLVCC
jgi:hypothetical protein